MNYVDKGGEEKSSLQEDVRASFREAGANAFEAEEMTWNVLGLIGTAGPDLTRRMRYMNDSTGEQQKILGLSVIAASMPLLDHRSSRKGHVYSFPESVKGECVVILAGANARYSIPETEEED